MMQVTTALESLSGPVGDEYEATDAERLSLNHRLENLRHQMEIESREPWKRIKKHVRSRLKLGKMQCVTFAGPGFVFQTSTRTASGWKHISPYVRGTIYTGVSHTRIEFEWSPKSEDELNRLIAATRDALAAFRME